MRVLIINSYAGSLVLGAKARNDEIIGSYESHGYGLPIQRENFPDLNFIGEIEHWPTQDLSETVVIAHPPCAAFSSQNRGGAHVRGPGSAAFKCTIDVLSYAMRNKAVAIIIESVIGAMDGGREVHDKFAHDYGYETYRVLINSCSVGVPQFRPRFWIVFVRRGVRQNEFVFSLQEKRRTIETVIENSSGKTLTTIPWIQKVTDEQLTRLRLILQPDELAQLFTMSGSLVRNLPRFLKLTEKEIPPYQVRYCMGHNYTSHSMVVLTPGDLAPTLMAGSWWFYKDRPFFAEEYKDVMGFPRDYKFPGTNYSPTYYVERIREYLSRGVCPPVATWMLDQVEHHINGTMAMSSNVKVVKSGEVADFRVSPKLRKNVTSIGKLKEMQ